MEAYLASLTLAQHLLTTAFRSVLSPFDKSTIGYSIRSEDPLVDWLVVLNLTVFFLAFILIVRHGVMHPIGWRVLKEPDVAKVHKFGDSGCELVGYFIFMIMGCSVAFTQDWVWPSEGWWEGISNGVPGVHVTMRDDTRAWFLCDIGRYSATLISLICLEHKRKDFLNMLVHHIVTILVSVVAYHYHFTRIGSIVKLVRILSLSLLVSLSLSLARSLARLLCVCVCMVPLCLSVSLVSQFGKVMDPADIPLHAAKMCKYLNRGHKRHNLTIYSHLSLFIF